MKSNYDLTGAIVDLQTTFQIYIRESIDKNRESKRLLELAKRAVEIAIEQDETAATALIYKIK